MRYEAKCACGKFGKRTGLGVLRVGTMWFRVEHITSEFLALPTEPCGGFGHGGDGLDNARRESTVLNEKPTPLEVFHQENSLRASEDATMRTKLHILSQALVVLVESDVFDASHYASAHEILEQMAATEHDLDLSCEMTSKLAAELGAYYKDEVWLFGEEAKKAKEEDGEDTEDLSTRES